MSKAICEELKLRSASIGNTKINTIYFGGGTPSLIEEEAFKDISKCIKNNYNLSENLEFTIEVNPEDVNEKKAHFWNSLGVNRYSIGIQSFFDNELKCMNRKHTVDQSIESVRLLQKTGCENISIDLIYGIPGSDILTWRKNLDLAFKLGVSHISVYQLTVEPNTALEKNIKTGKVRLPDEELIVDQFNLLLSRMEGNGFEHYEISNFSKPGFRSKHNASYWTGSLYYGFGPSAHSYHKKESGEESRIWNISNNQRYIRSLKEKVIPCEHENLSINDVLNEYIMTGLRTWKGCDLNFIKEKYGASFFESLKNAGRVHIENNKIIEDKGIWHLSNKGKLFADQVIADLFIV